MIKQLIECVPNFSEGRNPVVIRQIADAIISVGGIRLLHIDTGVSANRTVITFAGEPDGVVEAAFRGMKKASELIDMREHLGEHPRFGATDVCPLVPVHGITMEQTAEYARKLARRVGEELAIPVYCYEYAARNEERRSLANCRSGLYEGLPDKLKDPGWMPDFGPARFNAKSGATAIGARKLLVAYNVNLNTKSAVLAHAVACDVRESGRIKREGDLVSGKIVIDQNGLPVRVPGKLKKVRAMGWFIEEYGLAQVSMNLLDLDVTPIHLAFDEVCQSAKKHGLQVTGSELVGMISLQAMLDAGNYFLAKKQLPANGSDAEIIGMAVKAMGLDELSPFNPQERIIEYLLD